MSTLLNRRTFLKVSAATTMAAPALASAYAAEEKPPTIRIALITDTHTTRADKEDQSLYIPHFERVIEAVNADRPDLILFGGDQTQNGKPDEIDDFLVLAKHLHAPMRWVPGNHDIGPKHIVGQTSGVTAVRVASYEKRFGPSYFVEKIAGTRLIGINASILGSDLPIESAQWEFLEQTLTADNSLPTVVLVHYPPYLKTENEPGGDYWNIEPAPRARLLHLLDNSPRLRLVLSGHLHYPIRYTRGNVLYQTGAPVSFGLPRGKQPVGWTRITLPLSTADTLSVTTEFIPIIDTKESKL